MCETNVCESEELAGWRFSTFYILKEAIQLTKLPIFKYFQVCCWLLANKHGSSICLFVCFGCFVTLENFHWYYNITIIGKGLQILNQARHSWPLSSEGSLACQTYCDTRHPSIMVILTPRTHDTHIFCLAEELSLLF